MIIFNACVKKKIKHPYTKALKIVRYIAILFTIVALLTLARRFSLLKIPNGYQSIAPGSYVLIDWKFTKGRPLTCGDKLLYADNGKLKLATLIKMPKNLRAIATNHYLLKNENGNISLVAANLIKARILMILYGAEQTMLPK